MSNISLKNLLKVTGAKDWKESIVRLGFGEMYGLADNQWFNFILRLNTPEEIRRIIPLVGQYRGLDSNDLAEAMATLMENGTIMYVEFGRENSPVIHVFMRHPEENRAKMTALLERLDANEIGEFGPYGIRASWV